MVGAPNFKTHMSPIRKFLARIKNQLITFGGIRNDFQIFIIGQKLKVGYTLRAKKPERDYSIIMELAKSKSCVFDVGANHGIISLLIKSSNPNARVHAFEASEEAVNTINRNVLLNGFEKSIKVVNTLIADRSGYTIPFYWEGSSGGASIVRGRLGHTTQIWKSTLSLDDYAKSIGEFPDFIKMDIEGAENIAITGVSQILQKSRPDLFIELHEFGEKKLYENARDILNFVMPFDYVMIYLRTGNIVSDTEVMKDRGRCHVLLQPREKYSASFFQSLDLRGL